MHNFDTSDALDSDSQMFTTTASRIKCKFGRFGETTGVYVNSTAVKCANPSMSITPDQMASETIQFQLTMNGLDYDIDQTSLQFTFVGTGSDFGLGPTFVLIIMASLLIAAMIYVVQEATLLESIKEKVMGNNDQVVHDGQFGSNVPG